MDELHSHDLEPQERDANKSFQLSSYSCPSTASSSSFSNATSFICNTQSFSSNTQSFTSNKQPIPCYDTPLFTCDPSQFHSCSVRSFSLDQSSSPSSLFLSSMPFGSLNSATNQSLMHSSSESWKTSSTFSPQQPSLPTNCYQMDLVTAAAFSRQAVPPFNFESSQAEVSSWLNDSDVYQHLNSAQDFPEYSLSDRLSCQPLYNANSEYDGERVLVSNDSCISASRESPTYTTLTSLCEFENMASTYTTGYASDHHSKREHSRSTIGASQFYPTTQQGYHQTSENDMPYCDNWLDVVTPEDVDAFQTCSDMESTRLLDNSPNATDFSSLQYSGQSLAAEDSKLSKKSRGRHSCALQKVNDRDVDGCSPPKKAYKLPGQHHSNRMPGRERLFLCQAEACNRRFSRSDELTRHMRIHTGLKPYQCDTCLRTFSRSDHLTTHFRTHTGEKPFPCDVCGRRFSRSDERTRHKRVHSKQKHQMKDIDAGSPTATSTAWSPYSFTGSGDGGSSPSRSSGSLDCSFLGGNSSCSNLPVSMSCSSI